MITVFTPTYNRAYTLPKLYDSLKRQTEKKFEWLVVDDGSTDYTKELVSKWIREQTEFKIRYYYKQNGGKHTAVNLGVSMAEYDWFFIVDSDDYLTDDAVEKIDGFIRTVNQEKIAGVAGLKVSPKGEVLGGTLKIVKNGYIDAKNSERLKYGLGGDKAEVYRTDILKRFPFPVFEGEKFITEICVWNEIARNGYQIRWFAYPLMICEYRDDGLTYQIEHNGLMLENFEGYKYSMKYFLDSCSGINKLYTIHSFINVARMKNYDLRKLSKEIEISYPLVIFVEFLAKIKEILKSSK